MKGRKDSCFRCRCFGGVHPGRLFGTSLLINLPGTFFAYYVALPISQVREKAHLLYIGIIL